MLLYVGTNKDAPGVSTTGWLYGNFSQLKLQAEAAVFIIVLIAARDLLIRGSLQASGEGVRRPLQGGRTEAGAGQRRSAEAI